MSQQLRDWLGQTNNDERKAVADAAGTSVAHLWQLAGGHRKASLELAKRLEDASKGALTIEGLRSDIFAGRTIRAA